MPRRTVLVAYDVALELVRALRVDADGAPDAGLEGVLTSKPQDIVRSLSFSSSPENPKFSSIEASCDAVGCGLWRKASDPRPIVSPPRRCRRRAQVTRRATIHRPLSRFSRPFARTPSWNSSLGACSYSVAVDCDCCC